IPSTLIAPPGDPAVDNVHDVSVMSCCLPLFSMISGVVVSVDFTPVGRFSLPLVSLIVVDVPPPVLCRAFCRARPDAALAFERLGADDALTQAFLLLKPGVHHVARVALLADAVKPSL